MRDRRPILETRPNLFSSNVRRFLRGINVPPPHPSPHSPFSIKASMILGKSGRSFKYSYENVERKPFESNESNHPSRDGGTWFLFMHRRDGGMRIKEEEKKKTYFETTWIGMYREMAKLQRSTCAPRRVNVRVVISELSLLE